VAGVAGHRQAAYLPHISNPFLKFLVAGGQPLKKVEILGNRDAKQNFPCIRDATPGFLIYNTAGIKFFRRFSAMKFYGYNKCGTCRKAKTFLDEKNIKYTDIDITLTPPPKSVLKQAMKAKGMRNLYNTWGVKYK
jgi:glutaredoxin